MSDYYFPPEYPNHKIDNLTRTLGSSVRPIRSPRGSVVGVEVIESISLKDEAMFNDAFGWTPKITSAPIAFYVRGLAGVGLALALLLAAKTPVSVTVIGSWVCGAVFAYAPAAITESNQDRRRQLYKEMAAKEQREIAVTAIISGDTSESHIKAVLGD